MEENSRFSKTDYCFIAIIWILLLARCWQLGNGMAWTDEFFSLNLICDHSLSHMLHALGDGADGGMPLYYLVARAWAGLFSTSLHSLRFLSTFCFAVGFSLLYVTLRRFVGVLSAVLAVSVVLARNEFVAFETLNIRFYGLLFALVSLALYFAVGFFRPSQVQRTSLIANLLTNAALCFAHPLGLIYSVAILFGVLVSDLLARPGRFRWNVYLSYVVGWLSMLLWLKQLISQSAINHPHSWITVPTVPDLTSNLQSYLIIFPLTIILPVMLTVSLVWTTRKSTGLVVEGPSSVIIKKSDGAAAELIVSLSLLGVIPGLWIISKFMPNNSLFLGRYFGPSCLGWTVIIAIFLERFWAVCVFPRRPLFNTLLCLIVLGVLLPLWGPTQAHWRMRPVGKSPSSDLRWHLSGQTDDAFGYTNLPIVSPDLHLFMSRRHYAPNPGRYFYLLDWNNSISPEATRFEVVNYNLMTALKRNDYESGNTVLAAEFLASQKEFLVLNATPYNWCSRYLRYGRYKITTLEPRLNSLSDDQDVPVYMLLVQKIN